MISQFLFSLFIFVIENCRNYFGFRPAIFINENGELANITMAGKNSLRAFLPTSFGKKNPPKSSEPAKKVDPLSSYLPTSFGKRQPHAVKTSPAKKQKTDPEDDSKPTVQTTHTEEEDDFIGPPPIPQSAGDQEEQTTHQTREYPLPVTNMVELRGHTGAVLSLGIDPSGSRLISGSADYNLKFWDFQGMFSDYQR
jgi:hypothetical protein